MLERILGHKVNGLTLTEAGPGVAAIADVLEHYTGLFPSDAVLLLWPPAVLDAAKKIYASQGKTMPAAGPLRSDALRLKLTVPKRKAAAVGEDHDSALDPDPRRRKKRKIIQKKSSVPGWVDIPEPMSTSGRPHDPLARQLSVLCYDYSDRKQIEKLRCVGSVKGCTFSWACPRNRTRVLKHASQCTYIDHVLRQQASTRLSEQAPSVIVENLQPTPVALSSVSSDSASSSMRPETSAVLELASTAGRQQLKAVVDFDIVRFICAAGLPPFCVDRPEFKTMISHLNTRYIPVSSSTLADNQIPAEAARVLEKSLSILRSQRNLTLLFDGGDTRRPQSVYTFHVATPERRVFLIRGEDVSTESHTGEFIAGVASQAQNLIGGDRFAGVVTDGASNMVLARRILVEATPTMLNMSDPCHKLSLLIKDICKLEELVKTILILRRVLSFFGRSNHAVALLDDRRKLMNIFRGLEAIVDTRFGTVVISAISLRRCMPPIRELVAEGAIVIPVHNDLFMGSSPASLMFELQLTILIGVLDPILRGLTCLESSFSTPADVLLIFSATLSRLEKHLHSGSHGLSDQSTIDGIRKHSSRRFSELINESPDDLYVAAFYLDPLYRDTRLLKDIDPFAIMIRLRTSDEYSEHGPTVKMIRRIGCFLFGMLRKEWDNFPQGIVRGMHSNAMEAKEALRQQLLLYGTAAYPFSEQIRPHISAYKWWTALQNNPSSKLLAYFAIKLFSITPNSMADERTVSTFGWLNSALRSRQDVPTIVRQTQIRQFYAWNEEKHAAKPCRICYRDIKTVRASEPHKSASKAPEGALAGDESQGGRFRTDYSVTGDAWLDEPDEEGSETDLQIINVSSLVNLDAPEVEDCLADEAPAGLKDKREPIGELIRKASGSEDQDSAEMDWEFT